MPDGDQVVRKLTVSRCRAVQKVLSVLKADAGFAKDPTGAKILRSAPLFVPDMGDVSDEDRATMLMVAREMVANQGLYEGMVVARGGATAAKAWETALEYFKDALAKDSKPAHPAHSGDGDDDDSDDDSESDSDSSSSSSSSSEEEETRAKMPEKKRAKKTEKSDSDSEEEEDSDVDGDKKAASDEKTVTGLQTTVSKVSSDDYFRQKMLQRKQKLEQMKKQQEEQQKSDEKKEENDSDSDEGEDSSSESDSN